MEQELDSAHGSRQTSRTNPWFALSTCLHVWRHCVIEVRGASWIWNDSGLIYSFFAELKLFRSNVCPYIVKIFCFGTLQGSLPPFIFVEHFCFVRVPCQFFVPPVNCYLKKGGHHMPTCMFSVPRHQPQKPVYLLVSSSCSLTFLVIGNEY